MQANELRILKLSSECDSCQIRVQSLRFLESVFLSPFSEIISGQLFGHVGWGDSWCLSSQNSPFTVFVSLTSTLVTSSQPQTREGTKHISEQQKWLSVMAAHGGWCQLRKRWESNLSRPNDYCLLFVKKNIETTCVWTHLLHWWICLAKHENLGLFIRLSLWIYTVLTSTILVTQIREPPDISKSHSKSNATEHELHFAAPFLSFWYTFLPGKCFRFFFLFRFGQFALFWIHSPRMAFYFQYEDKVCTRQTMWLIADLGSYLRLLSFHSFNLCTVKARRLLQRLLRPGAFWNVSQNEWCNDMLPFRSKSICICLSRITKNFSRIRLVQEVCAQNRPSLSSFALFIPVS